VAKKAETEKENQANDEQQFKSAVKITPYTVITEPYYEDGELKYKETIIN
jgi:hypothetical protein